MSAIAATVFFRGWVGPGSEYIGGLWFVIKTLFIFVLLIWFRVTFPRLRIDHVMGFAWKFLFPLSVINLFIVAVEVTAFDGSIPSWMVVVNLAVAGALIVLWSRLFKLGGGRVEATV